MSFSAAKLEVTHKMSGNSYSDAEALELLIQLEHMLESDPLIDEVGFIHPSLFAALKKQVGDSLGSSEGTVLCQQDAREHENTNFWNKDHKLGISTQILLPLYRAAKNAFMTAFRQFSTRGKLPKSKRDALEREVMIHSRALLLLSSDFGTAWNSRKLIVSKKPLPLIMDELLLSALVLSHSPKSEQAWSHRRWVIEMISGKCSTLQQIIEKESELVEKIAESSKMNYRAWNHRCWLVSHMTKDQVLHELKKSRNWSGLHVADNSCFHYRRRLMLRILEDCSHTQENVLTDFNVNTRLVWKVWQEELDWNEALVKLYIGGEALWLHRRFLSLYWIRHITTDVHCVPHPYEQKPASDININSFVNHELCLFDSSSITPHNGFEDCQAQAMYSATYILWLTKQIPKCQRIDLEEALVARDIKKLLNKTCPERSSLWDYMVDFANASDTPARED